MSMPRIQQRFSIGHIPIPRLPSGLLFSLHVFYSKNNGSRVWRRRVALGVNMQTGLIELR